MADDRDAERFNPNHAKAGSPTGGEFSSSSGSGGGSKPAAKPAAAKPAVSGGGHGGGQDAGHARKARLLAEAHEDDEQARALEKELRGLQEQEHAAQEAAKKSAASAAAAKKAGHVVHHRQHTAAHKHHKKHAQTLKGRISSLKVKIHGLREHAADLEKQAHAIRAAGMVTNPEGTERLHQYWVHGEGAAKIGWGQPGDFDRCVTELGKYIKDPQGYCNLAHHAALGIYPATHAAEIKKATGRSAVTVTERAEMATASVNDLPDSAFAYIEPGGKKVDGKTTPRSLRHFPVHDADHVRNALSRAPQSPFGDKAMPKIRQAAQKFGVDVSDQPASTSRSELMRDYPLEDLHIVRSGEGGDGRTMEAFAAVFNQETAIQDHEGRYLEIIEPIAFNKRLSDLKRSRQGFAQVKVLFNHGRDMEGNPAERFQMPVAVPISVEATSRGLLTRTRFVSTPLGDEVLELVSSGAVTAMSFNGRIIRSDPQLGRYGRHRPDSSGRLTTVRRMELGLREFGPVLFPAYEGAEINGVRMSTPGTWEPDDEFDPALLPDVEAAPGEPFTPEEGAEHSVRYHQHQLYELRSKEAREAAGLVW